MKNNIQINLNYFISVKEKIQNEETIQKQTKWQHQQKSTCWAMDGSKAKLGCVPSQHLGNTVEAARSLCRSYALCRVVVAFSRCSSEIHGTWKQQKVEKKILATDSFLHYRQNSASTLYLATSTYNFHQITSNHFFLIHSVCTR